MYVWGMSGVCMGYVWGMSGVSLGYVWGILWYVYGMSERKWRESEEMERETE